MQVQPHHVCMEPELVVLGDGAAAFAGYHEGVVGVDSFGREERGHGGGVVFRETGAPVAGDAVAEGGDWREKSARKF